MSFAVQCRGLTKTFGEGDATIYALRGLDLDVVPGELMMLVGPSGCGKTTLISIIAGILKFEEGSCEVLGHALQSMRPRALLDFRAQNIGFIFQNYNLLPSLTVLENIAIPLIINDVPWEIAMAQAELLLDEVGLKDRGHNLPNQLSGGQQQRVAIARAIVHQPKLLVCDEPTSALDHETGMRIMALLRNLNQKHGTTIVVVTHDNRIFPYATRIAYMDDGRIESIAAPNATNAA